MPDIVTVLENSTDNSAGVTLRDMRLVVIAPTFNHGSAMSQVLAALALTPHPTIVVNDGSTDSTAHLLSEWLATHPRPDHRDVLAHTHNRGKAAALRTGFARARERGFTHALTIDTDGQHDVSDIHALLAASLRAPTSLIVGGRSQSDSDSPAASRIGRAISNWLVWCESGVRINDSQSGLRIYPLGARETLSGSASRYGYETQVISRAGWHGVPVVEIPVRCIYAVPGGRTTHFRLIHDTLLAVQMHAALLARAILFVPADHAPSTHSPESPRLTGSITGRLLRWLSPRRLIAMARGEPKARKQIAASVGVGLLIATLPIYGIKTPVCLWLAGRFRLHPLLVIGVSSLCTPPLNYLFIFASIFAGRLLLHGTWPTGLAEQITNTGVLELLGEVAVELILGSVAVGVALGLLGYYLSLALLARIPAVPAAPAALAAPATPATVVWPHRSLTPPHQPAIQPLHQPAMQPLRQSKPASHALPQCVETPAVAVLASQA